MTRALESRADESVPPTRHWKFSLATFMLAVALGLALLANFVQYRQSRDRQHGLSRVIGHWQHRYGWYEGVVGVKGEDPSKTHISLLPTGRNDEWIWQISLAERREFRICYAVDGVPQNGFPRSQGHSPTKLNGHLWVKFRRRDGEDNLQNGGGLNVAVFAPQSTYGSQAWLSSSMPPPNLAVIKVAGDGKRAEFPPDGPVELLRMTAKNQDRKSSAGSGLVIWLEPLK